MVRVSHRSVTREQRLWLPWFLSASAHGLFIILWVLVGQLERQAQRLKPIQVSVRVPVVPPMPVLAPARPELPKPSPKPKPKPLVPPPPAALAPEPAAQKGDPTVAPVFGVRKDAVRLGGSFKVSVGNSLGVDPSMRGPLTSDAEPGTADGTGVGARPVSVAQVTQMPRVARAAKPRYPEALRRLGTEGVVRVEIVIDVSGAVVSARVVESPDPAFVEAALEAARKTVFAPAKSGDTAVSIRLQIPVEFRLTD